MDSKRKQKTKIIALWYSDDSGFDPPVWRTSLHSFVEIGHEILSTDILSLPLIQVGQLSVTGERM